MSSCVKKIVQMLSFSSYSRRKRTDAFVVWLYLFIQISPQAAGTTEVDPEEVRRLVSSYTSGKINKDQLKSQFEEITLTDKGKQRGFEVLIEYGEFQWDVYPDVATVLYLLTEMGACSWAKLGAAVGEGRILSGRLSESFWVSSIIQTTLHLTRGHIAEHDVVLRRIPKQLVVV